MTVVHEPEAPPADRDGPGARIPAVPWGHARGGLGARLAATARRVGRGGAGRRGASRADARDGGRGDGLDLRNTWQVVAGSILVPLGVVLILMAWYGSAHTPYVQQQVPYLVSGSFAGLGCMVLGGLLYWAHWLYRLYDQADLHHEEHLQALTEAVLSVADQLGRAGAGTVPGTGSTGTVPGTGSTGTVPGTGSTGTVPGTGSTGTVVRTADGRYYHDPACPVVRHHADSAQPLAAADTAGLEPCRICHPPPADLPR